MMKLVFNSIVLLLIVLAMLPQSKCSFSKPYQINTNEYFKMPSLYKFESYDKCLGTYYEEAKFCYVKTYIKPDDTSELYNYIRNFSSMGKQHFRHDKLVRGICMNSCKEIIDQTENSSDKYFVPEFPMDTRVLNKCYDWLDISFIVLVCTLMLLALMSTEYDKHLMSLNQRDSKALNYNEKDFFSTPLPETYQKFLTAFSIRRNWRLLNAENKPETRELRCFQGFRIWSFLPIIFGHCAWLAHSVPILNPERIESHYHLLKSMIALNGGNIVQNFFFLSGFLNSVILLSYIEKNRFKYVHVWLKAFFYRLIRFAPVLVFLIWLHATWLYRMDNGPFWDKIVFAERQACRKNWWKNVLFINNYIGGDEKCMIHTWYISADFHLSALGTALLLLIVHKPKRTKIILGGSILISFVVAAIQSYVTKTGPIYISTPETLRNQFYFTAAIDNNFFDFYSPSHLNSGNYLIGLAIGLWYHRYMKANKKHQRKPWIHILWLLAFVCQIVLSLVGFYFYENNVEMNIFTALLSAFFKHIYGLVIAVFVVGIIFKYGFLIPKIFNHPMYRILGRLSFSVYMVHLSILMLLVVKAKNMSEVNTTTNYSYTIGTYLLSHVVALFLVLTIELPAHVIFKTLFSDIIEKGKRGKIIKTKEEINENFITQAITSTSSKV
ncbi:unnamed protein product [Diamesa hyperborea]